VEQYKPQVSDVPVREHPQVRPCCAEAAAFDLQLPLEQAAGGYRAMDERRAIKTLLTV
jgi:hypothetical protein